MSFVRTFSFSMPREEADIIKPGHNAYTALIPGRKFVAQAQSGLVSTNVWRTINSSGTINFVIYTEWSTMEDLQAYTNVPVIKQMEQILASDNSTVQIAVYEMIG